MSFPKTLLVGWDGADWDIARPLMEAGQMPCLASLVANGAAGELSSFAPYVSPMLWTTIATGHHPDRHGVHSFAELDPQTGEARAVGSASRRVKALWNIVSEQGGRAAVLGWMGSFPAEAIHGAMLADACGHAPPHRDTPWPLPPGGVYPPALAEDLAELRLRPHEVDPGLLGLFVPGLLEQDSTADPRLAVLLQRLAQLYTIQNAAVAMVGSGQPDFCAVYFHFLDLVCHEFIAYHPPRHPAVNTSDYARFREVVNAAYRVQDALLGDLLRHCAPDTTVLLVSDHGFTTGAARPARSPASDAALAAWHRREGIVVAHGPGIAHGRRLGLVRPHDLAPTLLAMLGLPRGDDMPGRVVTELFAVAPATNTIPSWEHQARLVASPTTPPLAPEADEQKRLTRRFVELGYLDPTVLRGSGGGEKVADVNRFLLGTALRDLGRPADALPSLQAAALADPESPSRATELALCLLDLGLADEAERALRPVFDHGQEQAGALFLRAQIAIARRRFPLALELVARLEGGEFAGQCAGLRRLILLRSGRHEEARAAFRAKLETDPNRVPALLGLAQACLWTKRPEEAASAARRALALDPASDPARRMLDEALLRQREGGTPPPASWGELAGLARQRAAWRTQLHRREQEFHATRELARRTAPTPDAAGETALAASRAPVLVVSGAPRSGTSMMMRMLALAGVPVLTDGVRVADADNPLGYFEWQPIKRLEADPGLIAQAEGKAVKIVSPLLARLPGGWRYEVVFMRRPTRAILASQERMVARLGGAAASVEPAELERHIEAALAALRARPGVRVMEINYDELLEQPEASTARLVAFIGPGRIKRAPALRAAIRRELRHHQAEPTVDLPQ